MQEHLDELAGILIVVEMQWKEIMEVYRIPAAACPELLEAAGGVLAFEIDSARSRR